VSAEGSRNSAGSVIAGSEDETVGQAARDDAVLAGQIIVSGDLQDDTDVEAVTAALREFAADIWPRAVIRSKGFQRPADGFDMCASPVGSDLS